MKTILRRVFAIILFIIAVACVANAQTVERQGNKFTMTKQKQEAVYQTKFTWEDSKGVEYPIFISKKSGACFVFRTSKKTGKEYKYYLGAELSMAVCKELGIEYKGKKPNEEK